MRVLGGDGHDELDDELVAEPENSQHSPRYQQKKNTNGNKKMKEEEVDQDVLANGSSVNLFQQVDYTSKDSSTFSKAFP